MTRRDSQPAQQHGYDSRMRLVALATALDFGASTVNDHFSLALRE